MSIKASTREEAFRFLDRKKVLKENREYSERAGYPTYFPYGDSSIDYRVTDLGCRIEVVRDGEAQNIWILDEEPKSVTMTIGLIETKKVLSSITINEVKELTYENVVGFVYEALDDGKPGIIYHIKDGTTVSFHVNEIAYTLMK
ncbi:hypothetical protein [Dorea sp.]